MKFFLVILLFIVAALTLNSAAAPTKLSVNINAEPTILQLNQLKTIPITITNTGPAATYEVQLLTANTMTATTSTQLLELQNQETKQFNAYVKSTAPGTTPLTIALISNQTIVKQKTLNLQTSHKHDATVYFPSEITNTNCNELQINGYAQNKGTTNEQLSVSINGQTQTLTVASFETTQFTFTLKNVKQLELKPQVTINGKTTTQTIKLTNNCIQTNHKYTVTITNNQKTQMKGLFATITGLPNGWQVLTRSPTDLAPGESTTFDVVVRETSENDEDIHPILQITDSKGSQVYKEQLPVIKSTSPITAQFTKQLTKLPQWMQLLLAITLLFLFLNLTFKNQPKKPKTVVTHDAHNSHVAHETRNAHDSHAEHQTHLQTETNHDSHNQHH